MGKKKRAEAGLEEEEAFPRGGGSGLAPIEKKRLQQVLECDEYASDPIQQACRSLHAPLAKRLHVTHPLRC